MTGWPWTVSIDLDRSVPWFQQVERAIQRAIADGRLKPGDAVPSTRGLAEQLGLGRNTVVAAYRELTAQGWLESRPGGATRVARALPAAAPRPRRAPRAVGFDVEPLPPLNAEPHPGRSVLRLGAGEPDLRLLPAAELSRAVSRAFRRRGGSLLAYGDPRGVPEYLRAVRGWLGATRSLSTDDDRLVSTRGAQHGLDLVARALIRPGDRVVVESLGYAPAWRAFRLAGAELVPAPVDAEGLDTDALARTLAEGPVRAVYVTSHHQYPTTVPLSAPRRRALLALAARHRMAVIEDDYDHEHHYDGRPRLPLASSDPSGSVIYLGTWSKVLAPGLRLGFVHGPPALIATVAELRRASDRQGDALLESALAELVDDGLVQRHLRKMRGVYRGRRDALVESLRAELGGVVVAEPPPGGIGLWARVDPSIDDEAWVARALDAGVALRPGRAFSVVGDRVPGLRMVFSALDEAQLREAVRRLVRSLDASS